MQVIAESTGDSRFVWTHDVLPDDLPVIKQTIEERAGPPYDG